MSWSDFTTIIWRCGMALLWIIGIIYLRELFIRSFFRFLRDRLGKSILLFDIEKHFHMSISFSIILFACYLGIIIAGYNYENTIISIFKYISGILLVLTTRAIRIVFTKWLIRSLGWDATLKNDYSRVLIVTEGLGVLFFFIISIEILTIYIPPSTGFNDILVIFFVILEIVCVLSFYTTVLNAVAGFFLIFSEPFRLGNLCTIDSNSGFVEQIALHSTKLRSEDGSVIHIPNGVLVKDVQRNFSDCTFRRMDLVLHVNHTTSMHRISQFIFHLHEELASCVISLEDFMEQEEKLKRQLDDENTSDEEDSKAEEDSYHEDSYLGSLRDSKPPNMQQERGVAASSTSTDISESMCGLEEMSRSTLTRTPSNSRIDSRILQVTLGGVHKIWISALVPGNSLMEVAQTKSKFNLIIIKCMQAHGIKIHKDTWSS